MTIRSNDRGGFTITLDAPFMGEDTWDLDGYLTNLRGAALRDAARKLGIRVKSSSKVGDIRHDMRNLLIARADQSGLDILADMLSLDGVPAKVTHVPNALPGTPSEVKGTVGTVDVSVRPGEVTVGETLLIGPYPYLVTEVTTDSGLTTIAIDTGYRQTLSAGQTVTVRRNDVPNPKPATVRPKSCGNPKVHSFCTTFQCTGRLGECEACHGADAAHSLVLSGTIAGSSGPVTKGSKLYLCTPCYRDALASVDDRGAGGFAIYWRTETVVGQPIRYNDPKSTTRYAVLNTGSYDAAWDAARQIARDLEPRYAPVITDVMFFSPNARRAYLVTRDGVDAVEYMTPAEAWGLAWDVRCVGGDGTFGVAEVDPMSGEILEWLWVGPRVGDVLVSVKKVAWTSATVTDVSPDGRTFTMAFAGTSTVAPMKTFDLDCEVKAGNITIERN